MNDIICLIQSLNDILISRGCYSLNFFAESSLTERVAILVKNYIEKNSQVSITEETLKDEAVVEKITVFLSDKKNVDNLKDFITTHAVVKDYDFDGDGISDMTTIVSVEDYQERRDVLLRTFSTIIVCGAVLLLCFGYIFGVTFFANTIPESNLRFVDQSLSSIYSVINVIVMFVCNNFFWGGNGNYNKQRKPKLKVEKDA